MATEAQLRSALDRAAADGNDEAAKELARRIKKLQADQYAASASHTDSGNLPPISFPDVTRSLATGFTGGHQDEIAGVIGAGLDSIFRPNDPYGSPFNQNYKSLRNIERQDQERFRNDWPGVNLLTEMGGALGSFGSLGARVAGGSAKLLPQIGLAEGSIAGHGYSDADTITGKARDTAFGGALGLGTAWGGPRVIKGIDNAARGAGRLANDMLDDSAEAQVRRWLEQKIRQDGMTLDDAMYQLQQRGPDAFLADIGPNMRGGARDVVSEGGPALARATDKIEGRVASRQDRLIGGLEESAQAQVSDYTRVFKATQKAREKMSAPLYNEAYAAPFSPTPELQRLTQTQIMQEVLEKARQSMARFDQPVGGNLRMLHEAKRQLDGMIGTAQRAGDDTLVRDLTRTKKALLKEMDASSPAYQKARNIWSDTMSIEDAATEGRQLLKGGKHIDEVEAMLDDLTDVEKEAFRLGAVRGVFDYLEDTADIGRVKQLLRKPRFQKLIKEVFPDEESKHKFIARLANEMDMQQTNNRVLAGSDTARILAGQKENNFISSALGVAADSVTGSGVSGFSIAGLMKSVGKMFSPGISDDVSELLGRALFGDMSQAELNRILTRPKLLQHKPDIGPFARWAGTAAPAPGSGVWVDSYQPPALAR